MMEVKLINLTPHILRIFNIEDVEYNSKSKSFYLKRKDSYTIPLVLQPGNNIPRVNVTRDVVNTLNGIPVIESNYGEIKNNPESRDGVYYIVSAITANAFRKNNRKDILVPNQIVRDEHGNIIGCASFSSFV